MSLRSRKLADEVFNVESKEYISVRWPEWRDVDLNNEKWTLPKNSEDGLFLDMESTPMPPSLQPHEWIRARYLKDVTEPLTVFTMTTEYPDLITKNKYMLHSEFVRWFISSVMNLRYCGKNGLEVSGESENFVWNGRQECWQGWMYIYSNNKAGRGPHRPLVNQIGKYVVRLYFLGCWRRVLVDDLIPIDRNGNPLLPRTANNSELWPMLLAKALLKIASLTWTPRREIVDFNPIVCLTGWICLPLTVIHLSPRDKWEFLLKYAEHFEWTSDGARSENEAARGQEEKVRQKKKRGKSSVRGLKLPDKPRPITLFLDLVDMKGVTPETVPGLSPCWSHLVHVVQSRDLPLDSKDVKPPLAKWKEHRWINWAIDHGILDPVEYFVPIRCLKIVSAMKKCKDQTKKMFLHREIDREKDTRKRKEIPSTTVNKSKEEVPDDVDFWIDFNRMAPFVKIIYLFYKPEYFDYTLRVSDSYAMIDDRKKGNVQPREQKKGSRKSAPSEIFLPDRTKFTNIYNWPRTPERSRNEPLYLFSDSLEETFFLINFSTVSSTRLLPSHGEDTDLTSLRCSSGEASYLVVERHSWFFRPNSSDVLISTSTSGNKSSVLELEPGRHILRIYCRTESSCFASISSNTIFHVGDRLRMHGLMTPEAERIDIKVKNISNSIAKVFMNFGSKERLPSMITFYQSYMPDLTDVYEARERTFFKQIHEYFMEELVLSIRRIFSTADVPDILFALRVFFLDSNIGLPHYGTSLTVLKTLRDVSETSLNGDRMPSLNGNYSSDSIEGEMVWIDYDQAARLIQSFFKMVVIKRYKARHNKDHKDHSKIYARLMKVADLFDYTKTESLAHILLRNVIWRNERFNEAYPCSDDFQYVLQVQECKGTLPNIKHDQWIPITRLIINAPENKTILGGMQLFASLPSYHLRLFDNETGREMLRLVNNVAPSNYPYTELGYTLVAYGWLDNQKPKDTEWILHFLTIKGKPMFYRLGDEEPISTNTRLSPLMIEESSGVYIPNAMNIISKWIVNIIKDSVLSFRLRTSYDLVRTKLKIVNESDDVLLEVEGGSVLCVPAIYLKFEPAEEKLHNTCCVEAYVLDNSWPLTDAEWSVVLEAKGKPPRIIPRIKSSTTSSSRLYRSDTSRTKRNSKMHIDQQLEPPYWKFQAVFDADSGVEFAQDTRRSKEIAAMKESWAADDPERAQRGKELRDAFLDAHALPTPSVIDLEKKISVKSSRRTEKDSVGDMSVCQRSCISRRSSIRTLKQPPSRNIEIPALDWSLYEKADQKVKHRHVRTKSEMEVLKEQRVMDVFDFFNAHDRFLRQLSGRTFEQVRKHEKSLSNLEENFINRKGQLEEAYELRRIYISSNRFIETPTKVKVGKKNVKA